MFQNTKFTLYFEKIQGYVHMKMLQILGKNKFTIEETNYTNMHSSGYFSVDV